MGLPSTYQQVVKNMKQIEQDHAILTDETNGLVAIADKVNDPTNGIDKINEALNDPISGLSVIADKVNDPNTGIDATAQKADEAKAAVDETKDTVEIISKYIDLPDNITIDPETGNLVQIDPETGEIIIDPDTGEPAAAGFPSVSYDDLVDLVEQLKAMFIEKTEDKPSAVDTTADGEVKVTGVHLNADNINTNLGPKDYKQGVTYEIKSTQVLFGSTLPNGISGNYCMLATFTKDSGLPTDTNLSGHDFKPFQIAYCTTNGGYYKRFAADLNATTWGSWISSGRTMEEMAVVSTSQPTGQLTGEFWYETIS